MRLAASSGNSSRATVFTYDLLLVLDAASLLAPFPMWLGSRPRVPPSLRSLPLPSTGGQLVVPELAGCKRSTGTSGGFPGHR